MPTNSQTEKGYSPIIIILVLLVLGAFVFGFFTYFDSSSEKSSNQGSDTRYTGPSELPKWSTHYTKTGFNFGFPVDILIFAEESGVVTLTHSVPYEHADVCDFVGDAPQLTELTDFNMTLELVNENFETVVSKRDPYVAEEGLLQGKTLTVSPGFIDEVTFGDMTGYMVTSGAEGCGEYIYYFPIGEDKTLIVHKTFEPSITYAGNTEALSLPELISDKDSQRIVKRILTSVEVKE